MKSNEKDYIIQLLGEQEQVKKAKLLGSRIYDTEVSVAIYQQKLNRILELNPPLEIDGQKGKITVDALYTFQKKYGLPINGQFDITTIEALNKNDPCNDWKVNSEIEIKIRNQLADSVNNLCYFLSSLYNKKDSPLYNFCIKVFPEFANRKDIFQKIYEKALVEKEQIVNKIKQFNKTHRGNKKNVNNDIVRKKYIESKNRVGWKITKSGNNKKIRVQIDTLKFKNKNTYFDVIESVTKVPKQIKSLFNVLKNLGGIFSFLQYGELASEIISGVNSFFNKDKEKGIEYILKAIVTAINAAITTYLTTLLITGLVALLGAFWGIILAIAILILIAIFAYFCFDLEEWIDSKIEYVIK